MEFVAIARWRATYSFKWAKSLWRGKTMVTAGYNSATRQIKKRKEKKNNTIKLEDDNNITNHRDTRLPWTDRFIAGIEWR